MKASDVKEIANEAIELAKGYRIERVQGEDIAWVCLQGQETADERLSERGGEPIKPEVDFARSRTLGGTLMAMQLQNQLAEEVQAAVNGEGSGNKDGCE